MGLLPLPAADRSLRVSEIRAAFQASDLGSARKTADELMQQESENFEGHFWRGFLELRLGNAHQAIRYLRRAEAFTSNPSVLKVLAVSYYMAHQYRLFLLKMNEALQIQPDHFAPFYYLGRYCNSQLTDFERAAGYFTKAIERNRGHFRSHYYLGHCYESMRDLDRAEREYQSAIQIAEQAGSSFALGYQGMARVRLLQVQTDKALPLALRAAELAPNDAESHRVVAKVYTALERPLDAVEHWERAAALDPTDAKVHYHLYRSYASLGKTDKARAALSLFKSLSAMYGND